MLKYCKTEVVDRGVCRKPHNHVDVHTPSDFIKTYDFRVCRIYNLSQMSLPIVLQDYLAIV